MLTITKFAIVNFQNGFFKLIKNSQSNRLCLLKRQREIQYVGRWVWSKSELIFSCTPRLRKIFRGSLTCRKSKNVPFTNQYSLVRMPTDSLFFERPENRQEVLNLNGSQIHNGCSHGRSFTRDNAEWEPESVNCFV